MTGGRGNGTMRWGRQVQVLRDEDNQTRAVHQHRPLALRFLHYIYIFPSRIFPSRFAVFRSHFPCKNNMTAKIMTQKEKGSTTDETRDKYLGIKCDSRNDSNKQGHGRKCKKQKADQHIPATYSPQIDIAKFL